MTLSGTQQSTGAILSHKSSISPELYEVVKAAVTPKDKRTPQHVSCQRCNPNVSYGTSASSGLQTMEMRQLS